MTTPLQITHKASVSTKQKPKKMQSSKQLASKSLNSGTIPHPLQSNTRDDLISKIAYRMAEKRGFSPGHELDDWLAAEFEVNQSLMGNGFM